ncbi:MAG TPA: protein kinase [Vicinamibacterales bacterium]|nr:protein kinase [Vicinamibacterales bacterium]
MRLPPGSTLGPYEITGALGAGGMGEVYRARDTRLGREVALKVLSQAVVDNAERLARFEREARSASALNHPGIVTIHDFGSQDGEAYLVMELVRGESLRDLLGRGPLPQKRLLAIAAGLADALAAAHAAGIVHRDLKPENVMVTSDGAPKILDFGLVRTTQVPIDATSSHTELHVSAAGSVLGTVSYMSPEQARGEPVDFRSDQFALGLILHEMATGRHPFRRDTPYETLAAILNGDPEPLDRGVPEPYGWVVERCLARIPSERYGSTSDLARDLERLRERLPSGVVGPFPGSARTASWRWWIAPAAAVVAGGLLALSWAWSGRASPALGNPVQAAVSTPELAEVHAGEVALPVFLSPDGHYLGIYGADENGTNSLWIHDLRSGATKQAAEKAFAAAWSRDSRAMAFFAEGKLKTVSVDGGPPRVVCEARPEGTPTWHGDTILFGQYSANPGIYRVNASGGAPERLDTPGSDRQATAYGWWPEFLPDGRRFLYVALRQPQTEGSEITHELLVGSLDGAAPQLVGAISSRAVFAEGHLLFVRDGTLLAQPFDPTTARFTGEARPLVEDLHYFRNTGLAGFTVSQNGLLAWRTARRQTRLAWLDRAGLEVGSLGTMASHAGGRFSPDGKRYVVGLVDPKQGGSDIWVHDLARDSRERHTFLLLDENSPVWGPDGTIYFRSDGGGPPDIFKLFPGREGREIVHRGPGVNEPADVSPDGQWLLFIDYTPPVGADIKVLSLTTPGPPRPFAVTPFQELSPRFSPDGRRVAYSSDVSGRMEVYVRPFEGAAGAMLISRGGGTSPRWSPDGKELYYLAPGRRLMAVDVGGDFGAPRMLFLAADGLDYEVAPDGSRFLMRLSEHASQPAVRLLINWRARITP